MVSLPMNLREVCLFGASEAYCDSFARLYQAGARRVYRTPCMSSPVVSGARRYATTVRIVPARHEGSVFASSVTGLSIDSPPAGVER